MRVIVFFITLTGLICSASLAALAQSQPADPKNLPGVQIGPAAPVAPGFVIKTPLDKLFENLKATKSNADAKPIERKIWRLWLESGSDTIDLLMTRVMKAMEKKDYAAALDLLDRIVHLRPGYAEGWNKRATVHFLLGNHAKSVADIEQVLIREPRHFGAMSGLGLILQQLGREKKALKLFRMALKIHPHMPGPLKAVERLKDAVDGSET